MTRKRNNGNGNGNNDQGGELSAQEMSAALDGNNRVTRTPNSDDSSRTVRTPNDSSDLDESGLATIEPSGLSQTDQPVNEPIDIEVDTDAAKTAATSAKSEMQQQGKDLANAVFDPFQESFNSQLQENMGQFATQTLPHAYQSMTAAVKRLTSALGGELND